MKHTGHALFAALLALPLLLGCPVPTPPGASRPASVSDLHVADLVIAGAARRGLDMSGRCADERRSRMVIVDASDEVMRSRIGYCASGGPICEETSALTDPAERVSARAERGCLLGRCVAGSIAWPQDDIWPANLGRWRAEIYVSAYLDRLTRRAALSHELVHWAIGCSHHPEGAPHSAPGMWEAEPGSLVLEVQATLAAEDGGADGGR